MRSRVRRNRPAVGARSRIVRGVGPGGVPRVPRTIGGNRALSFGISVTPSIGDISERGVMAITRPSGVEESKLASSVFEPQKITPRQKQIMQREQLHDEKKMGELEIEGTTAYAISFEELSRLSVCNVDSDLLHGSGTVGDPRLGTMNFGEKCITCGKSGDNCPGHYGMITLNQWYLNPMFARAAVNVLQSVCGSCSHLLCDRDVLGDALKLKGAKRLQAIADKSEKVMCSKTHGDMECRTRNPLYKREKDSYIVTCKHKIARGSDLSTSMDIKDIYDIFTQIPDEDLKILGFGQKSHPKNWVMKAIPVIPECTRTPVRQNGQLRVDHLTAAYADIIRHNIRIEQIRSGPKGPSYENELNAAIRDLWFHLSHFMNNSDGKYTRGKDVKVTSIKDRFTGKNGIPCGISMGKRVNFCGRTVAGPATCDFGEVCLPNAFKQTHTTPVHVHRYNLKEVTQMYIDGKIASIVKGDGRVNTNAKTMKLYVPKVGDVVERYVRDGDMCLINRHPSLHKFSMQAHRARFGADRTRMHKPSLPHYSVPRGEPHRPIQGPGQTNPVTDEELYHTIRIHSSTTDALNADYDGDELNLHFPGNSEALPEMVNIAAEDENIMNPQKNKPIIGLLYNNPSSAYAMTEDGNTVDPDDYDEAVELLKDLSDYKTLDKRLKEQGVDKYSGKGLFSILLPDTFFYDRGDVKIRSGVLVAGRITKKDIGAAPNSIIQRMFLDYPKSRVKRFVTEGQYVLDFYLTVYGLTAGIDDFIAPNEESVQRLIKREIDLAQRKIDDLGTIPEDSTELEKEYHETKIRNALNNIGRIGRKIGQEELGPDNPLNVMSNSGAKGSTSNTGQIVGAVAQQFIKGMRPALDITGGTRALPYFQPNSTDIRARGFAVTNFMQGLDVASYIFHMYASRLGLVNTAVSTADIGHFHDLLNRVSEDFKIAYDGSVRNNSEVIFQYVYMDGLNPEYLIRTNSKSTGVLYNFVDVKHATSKLNYYAQK